MVIELTEDNLSPSKMSSGAYLGAKGELLREKNGSNGIEKATDILETPVIRDKPRLETGQDWIELKMNDSEGAAGEESNDRHADESIHIPKNGFFSPHDEYHPPTLDRPEEVKPPPPPEKDKPEEQPPAPQSPEAQSIKSTSAMSSALRQSRDRDRSGSRGPEATNGVRRSSALSSMVFVSTALETIAASKEARKRKGLNDSVQHALSALKSDAPTNPEVIFEPLRLATDNTSIPLTTTALDCIGKLITYSYFSVPAHPSEDTSGSEQPHMPLIERAIDTICNCFQDEATPPEIQLQIVKSLLAAVLNDKIIVHGAGLLKAVRQIYNIFLLSKSSANQQVAQGTLTQMVGRVFERVKVRLVMKEARLGLSKLASEKGTANGSQVDLSRDNSIYTTNENDTSTEADGSSETASVIPSDQPVRKESGEKLTLQSFENAKNFDDTRIGDNAPTMVTRAIANAKALRTTSEQRASLNGHREHVEHSISDEDEEDEIYVKDAFLVFRSMCRLAQKVPMQHEQQDLKNQVMRSKLISLAIIRTLLNNNTEIFTSPLVTIRSSVNNEPASFGQAITQYLRLTLSRNGASSVKQVFETSCEIFWLMLKYMRVMLKVCTSPYHPIYAN